MRSVTASDRDELTDRLDFATTDIDAFQDVLARLLQPRQPAPVVDGRPGARHHPRLHYRRAGDLAFASIYYDQDVRIEVSEVADCFFLQIPETVGFEALLEGRYVDFPVGAVQLAGPGRRLSLRWRGGCRSLVVRSRSTTVADHLARLSQAEPMPRLPEKLLLSTPPGASLARFIGVLRGEAERDSPLFNTPLACRQAEHMLVALLLEAAGLLEEPERAPAPPSCYYVKRAQDFIHANVAEPIGLADIVVAGGVSVRALYAGFRRELGQPPMAYLKALRLDRTRAALTDADPGTTRVTDVAAEWGFFHFGKFAADYRSRFGEKPSETLRRAR